MKQPQVSVVICTLDRIESLFQTLNSIFRQTLPQESIEIVVVDNCGSDQLKAACTLQRGVLLISLPAIIAEQQREDKDELLPEFCTYSNQQWIRVYIRNLSEAKFAVKNSGIRYFFKSILLKTEITRIFWSQLI